MTEESTTFRPSEHGPWTQRELIVDDIRNCIEEAYYDTNDQNGPNWQYVATMVYDQFVKAQTELLHAFAPTTPPADVDPEVILEMFKVKHDLSPDAIDMLRELMQR